MVPAALQQMARGASVGGVVREGFWLRQIDAHLLAGINTRLLPQKLGSAPFCRFSDLAFKLVDLVRRLEPTAKEWDVPGLRRDLEHRNPVGASQNPTERVDSSPRIDHPVEVVAHAVERLLLDYAQIRLAALFNQTDELPLHLDAKPIMIAFVGMRMMSHQMEEWCFPVSHSAIPLVLDGSKPQTFIARLLSG